MKRVKVSVTSRLGDSVSDSFHKKIDVVKRRNSAAAADYRDSVSDNIIFYKYIVYVYVYTCIKVRKRFLAFYLKQDLQERL